MAQSRGPTILIAMWTTTSIATFFVAARVYTRLKILRSFGLDDYLMVFSIVCLSCINFLSWSDDLDSWPSFCRSYDSCGWSRRWPVCQCLNAIRIWKSGTAEHGRVCSRYTCIRAAEAGCCSPPLPDLQPESALETFLMDIRWRQWSSNLWMHRHYLCTMPSHESPVDTGTGQMLESGGFGRLFDLCRW
jgi:hypothetical protein